MRRQLRKASRRFIVSPTGERLLSWLGATYIRAVRLFVSWEVVGTEHMERAVSGGPVIAVFWHGRLLLIPTLLPPDRQAVAMISKARDGDTITAIVGRFGIETARGSTYDRRKGEDKGGAEAFAYAERALEKGWIVGLTPDGPTGPRMRAHRGAAMLAIASGAPVLPISFSTARGIHLRSWDRFLVSWPFGRGAVIYGELMTPDGRDVETFRMAIETALTAIQDQADALTGRTPVKPDAAA